MLLYKVSNLEWKKDKTEYPEKTYKTPNATEFMWHVPRYGSTMIQEPSFSYLWDGFGCDWLLGHWNGNVNANKNKQTNKQANTLLLCAFQFINTFFSPPFSTVFANLIQDTFLKKGPKIVQKPTRHKGCWPYRANYIIKFLIISCHLNTAFSIFTPFFNFSFCKLSTILVISFSFEQSLTCWNSIHEWFWLKICIFGMTNNFSFMLSLWDKNL